MIEFDRDRRLRGIYSIDTMQCNLIVFISIYRFPVIKASL